MSDKSSEINPLICDTADGLCLIPGSKDSTSLKEASLDRAVKVIYYTDPICSSCWGIEPQLRKLKLEYGHELEVEYRMGGLLPDWSYNSGGISKPSDVAHHWDEVSIYYDMPIDGDVWLEDPLHSSYPPSIAFKAAQIQDNSKALLFLREIREMVLLQKKNITKWEHLSIAAETAGLDTVQLKTDMEGRGKTMFYEDLKLAREAGVRGFPTMFFVNKSGQSEKVYGSKPYSVFEQALLKSYPSIKKKDYQKSPDALFSIYKSLTAREFSELSGTAKNESEEILNRLSAEGKLMRFSTKNGSIWIRK